MNYCSEIKQILATDFIIIFVSYNLWLTVRFLAVIFVCYAVCIPKGFAMLR